MHKALFAAYTPIAAGRNGLSETVRPCGHGRTCYNVRRRDQCREEPVILKDVYGCVPVHDQRDI